MNRCLPVDDDTIRTLTCNPPSGFGVSVDVVSTAVLARGALAARPFDVKLLDLAAAAQGGDPAFAAEVPR